VAEFLSDEWLDELGAAAGTVTVDDEDLRLVVQQVVARGDLDAVTYHLRVEGGRLSVIPGPAAEADLTFWLDRDTALAIHRGELSAQTAFLEGRLRVDAPRPDALTGLGALTALDDVFRAARA
jgi:putative sterol carrier protein